MKKIKDFIKTSCTYTVIMLLLVYLFSVIMEFENKGIEFPRFALLIAFGAIIAAAGFLFKIQKIGKLWQTLLHYCVLLFAFTVIFTWSGMLGSTANIFSSFFVFTFFYLITLGASHLAKFIQKKLAGQMASYKSPSVSQEKKSSYKPRFDNFD